MGKDRTLLGAHLPERDEEGVHKIVHRLLGKPSSLDGKDPPAGRGPFLEEDARAGFLVIPEEKGSAREIHFRGRKGIRPEEGNDPRGGVEEEAEGEAHSFFLPSSWYSFSVLTFQTPSFGCPSGSRIEETASIAVSIEWSMLL